MTHHLLNGLCVLLALSAPLTALRLTASGGYAESGTLVPLLPVPETSAPESGARTLLALAEEQTPFRPNGELPFLRFGETPPVPPPPPPVVQRPKLTVTGIAWGAEPVAIVEGLPGREWPVAMAQGASEGGFRVTRIERERVTISGMDTIWVLRVREAW